VVSVNNAEIKSRPNNTPSTIANTLIIESSVNNAEIKSRPNNTPSTIANTLIIETSEYYLVYSLFQHY
jgi:hypothetical protein